MSDAPTELTQLEQRFVAEYVADGNATQAYLRAYGRGGSYQAARRTACDLLTKPHISAAVAAANEDYNQRLRVSKLRTLREIAAVAFADIGDLYESDPVTKLPRPIPWELVPPAMRRVVQSVKTRTRRVKRVGSDDVIEEVEEHEYKLLSKLPALEQLCKKLGFFADAPTSTGPPAVVILPDNGRDRDAG